MKDIVGLKIRPGDSLAKGISIVRKYKNAPIGEIKREIQENEYVLVYSRIDDRGLKQIIKCYKELTKEGLKAELFEGNDEPTTLELLKNLDNTYDEISDDIDAEDDEF